MKVFVKVGGAITVIVKVCTSLLFEFGDTLLPSSLRVTLIVAIPLTLPAGVYVSVPVLLMTGPALNSAEFVLPVMLKLGV